jgi:uncharacterized protein YjlB
MATRVRLGKQLEKSVSAHSIIKTDASNEQEYLAAGANGEILTITAGVPTWAAPVVPSEFEVAANVAAFPAVGLVDTIYYATAENTFHIWNGASYTEVPAAASFAISIAGDSGANQAIANGDVMSILASAGFTTVASATDTITVNPPAGTVTGQLMTWNNTTSVWEAVAAVAQSIVVAGAEGANQTVTNGDTLTVRGLANSGVITTGIATDILEISLREQRDVFTPASAATTVTASQTPSANLKVYRNGILQDITEDYTVAAAVITLVEPIGISGGGGAIQERIVLTYRYA